MRAAAALSLLAIATPSLARAEPPAPLEHDVKKDVAITASGAALYLGLELLKGDLAPTTCRWCDPGTIDAKTRDALVWSHGAGAKRASDVLAVAIPVAALGHQLLAARAAGDTDAGWIDGLIIAETAILAMDLNQIVKYSVGRQRPFVHYGNFAEPDRKPDPDDNLSFYSGHTTFTFAVAAAAGTVSSMRGYPSAPWVWGIGMTLAATTGYLRIAADKHYLSDVLVGAATGIAAGVAVPRLLHPKQDPAGTTASVTVVPYPVGVAFVF
jgi:membrane-associated phospholipid phosphatase